MLILYSCKRDHRSSIKKGHSGETDLGGGWLLPAKAGVFGVPRHRWVPCAARRKEAVSKQGSGKIGKVPSLAESEGARSTVKITKIDCGGRRVVAGERRGGARSTLWKRKNNKVREKRGRCCKGIIAHRRQIPTKSVWNVALEMRLIAPHQISNCRRKSQQGKKKNNPTEMEAVKTRGEGKGEFLPGLGGLCSLGGYRWAIKRYMQQIISQPPRQGGRGYSWRGTTDARMRRVLCVKETKEKRLSVDCENMFGSHS